MPTWKSLFLHEFADDNLASCNCVEGGLEPFPPQGFVIADPLAQPTRFFAVIGDAKWFRFTPREVQKNIIGADITVELSINLNNFNIVSFPVVRLRDSLSLSVRFNSPSSAPQIVDGIPTDIVTLLLSLGGSEFRFERLLVKQDQFVRIRLSWHTNGQARLHVNGQLFAFANDFATSTRIDAASLEIGDTDTVPLPDGGHSPHWFHIRHLDVKLLRENDHSDPISDR